MIRYPVTDLSDFQLFKCPTALASIGCQIVEVLPEVNIQWDPGRQRDKKVEVLVVIEIQVRSGECTVRASV